MGILQNFIMKRVRSLTKPIRGIIDRFEGDIAIIEIDGQTQDYERSLLPAEAKAGDVVILGDSITIDREGTKERRERVKRLMNDLWED